MRTRMVVVHDGMDYHLVNYLGNNLEEAQELFNNGKLESAFRFTFFDKIRENLRYFGEA